ncbi:MAG: hypothetical protein ACI9VR_004593 [Cognaticolwellia sp.]|jgi:hypothetical protein
MWLLSLACSPDPTPALLDSDPALSWESAEPVWSAQDVEAAALTLMQSPIPRVDHLTQDYLVLMAQGTASCPGLSNSIKDNAVYGCETDAGMYFSGVSDYFDETRDGQVYRSLAGDFLIRDTLGNTLDWGAGWEIYFGDGASQFRWMGSTVWSGRPATVDGISVTLSGTQDQGAFQVSGGMKLEQGTVELTLERDADCPLAKGTLSVRGPDKRWYRTELDCSGCGPLNFEGQDLGQACIDPTPLLDTLEAPLMDADWSNL